MKNVNPLNGCYIFGTGLNWETIYRPTVISSNFSVANRPDISALGVKRQFTYLLSQVAKHTGSSIYN